MFYLATTRFTNDTYKENINYRNKQGLPVIYGSPVKIRDKYPIGSLIFVIEMNISKETNRIEGIGLIRNNLVYDKQHKIYENGEYNRYIYKGDYWISRKDIDTDIVTIFDTILFKGKTHQKRYIGVTMLTEKLFIHWPYELYTLKNKIRNIFVDNFKTSECFEKDEEPDYFEIEIKSKTRKNIK